MKAIITVVGKDKAGIVAGVATKVVELGLNIDDISNRLMNSLPWWRLYHRKINQDLHTYVELKPFGESLNVKSTSKVQQFFDAMPTCKIGSSKMDIKQVTETIAMIEEQNFDVRTVTMGVSPRLYPFRYR